MSPRPLRTRIIGALELAPMTTVQLTRALSANPASVRHYVDELRGMRLISAARRQRVLDGRPRSVWRLS